MVAARPKSSSASTSPLGRLPAWRCASAGLGRPVVRSSVRSPVLSCLRSSVCSMLGDYFVFRYIVNRNSPDGMMPCEALPRQLGTR